MKINTFKDPIQVHRAVAKEIIEAIQQRPNLVLGLSTGSTPLGTYAELVKDHQENGTDYGQVITFNLDEYEGLDPNDPKSYRHFMNQHLFGHLNINQKNTHVPLGTGDIEKECRDYEDRIKSAEGIDIQLLGIGINGHIGFNEPGTSFDTYTHAAELSEDTILANSKFFESPNQVPTRAITMGIKSILQAKRIFLIALGLSKAQVIKGMVSGPVSESLPASVLQNHADVTLFLNEEAASLL
ncbi:MAG: glucosamine-6-phosphate deaminase [Cyclobacteriaceae bacterium]